MAKILIKIELYVLNLNVFLYLSCSACLIHQRACFCLEILTKFPFHFSKNARRFLKNFPAETKGVLSIWPNRLFYFLFIQGEGGWMDAKFQAPP